MFQTNCNRCGEVLFDEYVITAEGSTKMKRCIMCGARYFENILNPMIKKCKYCGAEIYAYKYLTRRQVCDNCRKKMNKKRKVKKTCIRCGKEYWSDPRTVTKYCRKCLSEVRRQQASERRKKHAVSV